MVSTGGGRWPWWVLGACAILVIGRAEAETEPPGGEPPLAELVFSPRLYLFLAAADNDGAEVDVGGSLGVRFTDPARTWAVHPELALSSIGDDLGITLGLSIAAGNGGPSRRLPRISVRERPKAGGLAV